MKKDVTIKDIIDYLKPYDKLAYKMMGNEEKESSFDIIPFLEELYSMLSEMSGHFSYVYGKNSSVKVRGKIIPSDFFFYPAVLLFYRLLRQKRYYSFIHELTDFLTYDLRYVIGSDAEYLPYNCKYGLLHLFSRYIREQQGYVKC